MSQLIKVARTDQLPVGARKPCTIEDRRTSKITVRLTPAQRQVRQGRAELHGVSTSSYIVGRALGNSLRPAFAQRATPFMPLGS